VILPEGHESMTDAELARVLVDELGYDPDDAAEIVELVRSGDPDEAPA
jgi:glucan phosphorylase